MKNYIDAYEALVDICACLIMGGALVLAIKFLYQGKALSALVAVIIIYIARKL